MIALDRAVHQETPALWLPDLFNAAVRIPFHTDADRCVIAGNKADLGAPRCALRRWSSRPLANPRSFAHTCGKRKSFFSRFAFRICIGGFSDDRIRSCSILFCAGRCDFRIGVFDRRTRLHRRSAASLHGRCVSALRLRYSRRRSRHRMHGQTASAAQSGMPGIFQILRIRRNASHGAIASQGPQAGSRAAASQAQAASRQMIARPQGGILRAEPRSRV